jgi:FkbM family methyltransferase
MIVENRYGRYSLPKSMAHRPVGMALRCGGVWESTTIQLLQSGCAHSIIHAGAFIGDMLPALSQALAPGKVIYAFEPNPESCEAAVETIALNQLGNVHLSGRALGPNSEMPAVLGITHRGTSWGGGSRIFDNPSTAPVGEDTIKVTMVRLDDVIPADERISLIHLDVEGYEEKALRGAERIINQWHPALIIEWLNHKKKAGLVSWLEDLGYHHSTTVDANWVWKWSAKC